MGILPKSFMNGLNKWTDYEKNGYLPHSFC